MDINEFKEKIAEAKMAAEETKRLDAIVKNHFSEKSFDLFSKSIAEGSSVGDFRDFITKKMIELFGESDTISLENIVIEFDKLPKKQVYMRTRVKEKTLFRGAVYETNPVEGDEYETMSLSSMPEPAIEGFALWAKTALNVKITMKPIVKGTGYFTSTTVEITARQL